MTTDSEDRSIGTLMQMDTYRDMTDSEIDRLIEYKANLLFSTWKNSEQENISRENARKRLAVLEESCESSRRMLESILNRKPIIDEVGEHE